MFRPPEPKADMTRPPPTAGPNPPLSACGKPANYEVPDWSAIPTLPFSLTTIRNGVELEPIDLRKMCQEKGVGYLVMGRQPTCDILLDHASVSREHLVIQFRDLTSQVYLYDLGSAHGTAMNKNRIAQRTYIELEVGSTFVLGASSRMYVLEGPEELRPSEKRSRRSVMESKMDKAMVRAVLTETIRDNVAQEREAARSLSSAITSSSRDVRESEYEDEIRRSAAMEEEDAREFEEWLEAGEENGPGEASVSAMNALLRGPGSKRGRDGSTLLRTTSRDDDEGPVVVDDATGLPVDGSATPIGSINAGGVSEEKVGGGGGAGAPVGSVRGGKHLPMTEKQYKTAMKLRDLRTKLKRVDDELARIKGLEDRQASGLTAQQMHQADRLMERRQELENNVEDVEETLFRSYKDRLAALRGEEPRGDGEGMGSRVKLKKRRKQGNDDDGDDGGDGDGSGFDDSDDDDEFYDRTKVIRTKAARASTTGGTVQNGVTGLGVAGVTAGADGVSALGGTGGGAGGGAGGGGGEGNNSGLLGRTVLSSPYLVLSSAKDFSVAAAVRDRRACAELVRELQQAVEKEKAEETAAKQAKEDEDKYAWIRGGDGNGGDDENDSLSKFMKKIDSKTGGMKIKQYEEQMYVGN